MTGSPRAYLAWTNDAVSSQQPRETAFWSQAEIVVNGARRVSWRGTGDVVARVAAAEARGRVRLEVIPRCPSPGPCVPVTRCEGVAAGSGGS
jgi:hypothetical protein